MITEKFNLAAKVGSLGSDKALLGTNWLGKPFILDKSWRPHALISGATGTGKGVLVRNLQCHDLAVGTRIAVIQPKPGENGWLDGAATIATTPEQWCETFERFTTEQNHRQAICENYVDPATGIRGLDNINELPPQERLPAWRLYVDEVSGVLGKATLIRATNKAARDDLIRQMDYMASCVTEIVQRGRSTGIHLVLITQRPTVVANFADGSVGAAIFANMEQQAHGDAKGDSLDMAFDHCGRPDPEVVRLVKAAGKPGRMAYSFGCEADGPDVQVGQVVKISKEQARSFAINAMERQP